MTNYDYLYDKKYHQKWMRDKYFVEKELGYQEIKDGVILPWKKVNTGTGLGGGGD